jgi:hypothetical protein
MFLKKLALAGAVSLLASSAAFACEIGARVSVVGNEFPAIQTVGANAQANAALLARSDTAPAKASFFRNISSS